MDLITASEAATMMRAASMRVTSGPSARRALDRWGVEPVARQPGRGGESLYRRADVEHAINNAPGRGARTDLHRDRGDHR